LSSWAFYKWTKSTLQVLCTIHRCAQGLPCFNTFASKTILKLYLCTYIQTLERLVTKTVITPYTNNLA
jgi:hypothetical protein